jgi:hypothetical protein
MLACAQERAWSSSGNNADVRFAKAGHHDFLTVGRRIQQPGVPPQRTERYGLHVTQFVRQWEQLQARKYRNLRAFPLDAMRDSA